MTYRNIDPERRKPPVKDVHAIVPVICARISCGMSLVRILRQKGMPNRSTFFDWVARFPEVQAAYGAAISARGMVYGEHIAECLGELEEVIAGVVAGQIEPAAASAAIMGIRAKIDTHKWTAARMNPKVYGDKVALTGADGGAIKHEHHHDLTKLSDAELDTLEGIVGKAAGTIADPSGEDTTRH